MRTSEVVSGGPLHFKGAFEADAVRSVFAGMQERAVVLNKQLQYLCTACINI